MTLVCVSDVVVVNGEYSVYLNHWREPKCDSKAVDSLQLKYWENTDKELCIWKDQAE